MAVVLDVDFGHVVPVAFVNGALARIHVAADGAGTIEQRLV